MNIDWNEVLWWNREAKWKFITRDSLDFRLLECVLCSVEYIAIYNINVVVSFYLEATGKII